MDKTPFSLMLTKPKAYTESCTDAILSLPYGINSFKKTTREHNFTVSFALNLNCGAEIFGKIRSACGQHEIQHAERRMNK